MKRRRFLSLIGAATTAPLIPMPSLRAGAASVAAAPYSKAALHGAIMHAQSSRYISAFGLTKLLKVSVAQADALMADLAGRGVIAPLSGAKASSRWAASRVHHPVFARVPRSGQHRANRRVDDRRLRTDPAQPDIDLLLAHLRDLSTRYFAAKAA